MANAGQCVPPVGLTTSGTATQNIHGGVIGWGNGAVTRTSDLIVKGTKLDQRRPLIISRRLLTYSTGKHPEQIFLVANWENAKD